MEQIYISLPKGWKEKLETIAINRAYETKTKCTYLDLIRDAITKTYELECNKNDNDEK